MAALRVVVCGVEGRMGRRVAALAQADRRFELYAGVVPQVDASRVSAFPLVTADELASRLADTDILIDFSAPDATVRFAALAAKTRTPIVIGTTGLRPDQTAKVEAASRRTPLFLAANFSPGMAALTYLARRAGEILADWDAAICETHHAAKRDAPSGSALRLAEAARPKGAGRPAAIVSQRLGDVVGDHVLTLAGPSERLELTHRAQSRDVFARGALDAASWLRGRKAGLYGMADLLRLS